MKCPTCDYNQRRGREGMTCKECGYDFVFDPKSHGITDGKFLATVSRASANDTYLYTENQLYAAACRRLRVSWGGLGLTAFVAVGVFWVLPFGRLPWYILTGYLSLFGLIALVSTIVGLRPRLKRRKWDKQLKLWQKKGKPLSGLITGGHLNTPPPDWNEPDIYDYGVEQVLVCERDEIVDWLVLNRYHVTTKTAVISESGYPNYLVSNINDLLASANPPEIYLLHDSTPAGQTMAERFALTEIFETGNAKVIDLGLDKEILPRIRSVRRVCDSLKSTAIPIDALPFTTLTAMTTCAFADHCAFSAFQPDSVSETGVSFESSCSDDGDGE